MKQYITFGQDHIHRINEQIIDKDCVVELEGNSFEEIRKKALECFGTKFSMQYSEERIDEEFMKYFPRGIIKL